MQDLISDGQCPFSPPRAPPHGFPHFLFAAAQQAAQSGMAAPMEDPASALLRERTIMALDSFIQQQQQLSANQGSPQPKLAPTSSTTNGPSTTSMASEQRSSPTSQAGPYLAGSMLQPPPEPAQMSYPAGPSPNQQGHIQMATSEQQQQQANIQQLIIQQQHFAAAMAAAVSSGTHPQHMYALHGLFGPPVSKQGDLPSPVSPITSAAPLEQLQGSYLGPPASYHTATLGGAPSHFQQHYSSQQLQQAMLMAAAHQHQVAPLSLDKSELAKPKLDGGEQAGQLAKRSLIGRLFGRDRSPSH